MNRRRFLQGAGALAVASPLLPKALAQTGQAELHVSSTGDDAHAGTVEAPFRTIHKALEVSREHKRARGFPAVVYLHGGVYELPETLRLTEADGGTAAFPLRLEAHGDGEVALSGGTLLDLQWKPYQRGIYRAAVPAGTKTDQLFIDGKRQTLARYPNYDKDARYLNGTATEAQLKERSSTWKHPEGGYIHGLQASLWGSLHYRITGRKADGSLALEGGWQIDRDQPMHQEFRFAEGIFEELDAPGEWYLDEKESVLYYYPEAGVDLTRASVEVVRLVNLVEIGSRDGAVTRGIQMCGISFRHAGRTFMETREQLLRSDWRIFRGGAVLVENVEDVELHACDFDQVGGNAFFVSGYARRVGLRSCRIEEAGSSGVCFVGRPEAVRNALLGYYNETSLDRIDRTPGPKSSEYPQDCYVDDCLITRTGRFEKQSAGVHISMSSAIRVTHCSIYGLPRAGINVGDGTWGGHIVDGCDVFETVLETSDHGAFNSWGRDRWWHLHGAEEDDLLTGTLLDVPTLDAMLPITLTRTRWACAHGWDIDLDDGSSNYCITENLCLCGGIKFREGYLRTAENNVLVNNSFHPHVWPEHSSDIIRRNIVFAPYQPIHVRGWGAVIDSNFLHYSGMTATAAAVDLQQLSGNDHTSLTGDALFTEPLQGDFSLRPGSPAVRLGIESLTCRGYGVRSGRLRKIARSPEIARWLATPSATLSFIRQYDRRKWMGIEVRNLVGQGEMSEKGAPTETGVIVELVPAETAAARAGVQPGDLLLKLDGVNIDDTSHLSKQTTPCGSRSFRRVEGLRNQKPMRWELFCE